MLLMLENFVGVALGQQQGDPMPAAPDQSQSVELDSSTNAYRIEDDGTLVVNTTRLQEIFEANGTIPTQWLQGWSFVVDALDLNGSISDIEDDSFFLAFLDALSPLFPQLQPWFDTLVDARNRFLQEVAATSGSQEDSGGGTNVGLIVGCVVGSVAFVGILAAGFIVYYRRRYERRVDASKIQRIDVKAFDDMDSMQSLSSLALSQVDAKNSVNVHANDPVLSWISSRHSVCASAQENENSPAVSAGLGYECSTSKLVTKKSSEVPNFLSNLEFDWSDIECVKSLGVGSFGKVFLAKWNETAVAIKVLLDARELYTSSDLGSRCLSRATSVAAANPEKLLDEIRITAALRHPNVVQFMGFSLDPPSMATEFCPRGSLYDVLYGPNPESEQSRKPISWLRRVAFAADAAAGMLHLHTRNPQIIHRDLKSPNLLVASDWTVKVADMGLSKLITESVIESGMSSSVTSGGALNPRWLAPEILKGSQCTTASDVYAFGMVMWEILARQIPWKGSTAWSVVGSVQNGDRPPLDVSCDITESEWSIEAYKSLIDKCWDQNPDNRPDFAYIAQQLREMQKKLLREL